MGENESFQVSPLEHAVTTVLACLSLVKYKAALEETQKRELIGDLEKTLQFLSDLDEAFATQQEARSVRGKESEGEQRVDQRTLADLYKVYQTYLGMERGGVMGSFVGRFNESMATIDEVQKIIENYGNAENYGNSHEIYTGALSIEDALHRVRGFLADLYYIFLEFIRALAAVLQHSSSQIDTEELSSLPFAADTSTQAPQKPYAPLFRVYEKHLLLKNRNGSLQLHVNESIAFLEFLKESLSKEFHKRDEMIIQMNKIARLLREFERLLTEYEGIISRLYRSS